MPPGCLLLLPGSVITETRRTSGRGGSCGGGWPFTVAGRTRAAPSARRGGRDTPTPATICRRWWQTTAPSGRPLRATCRPQVPVVPHAPAAGDDAWANVVGLGHPFHWHRVRRSCHAERPLDWVEEGPLHPCLVTDVGVPTYTPGARRTVRDPGAAPGPTTGSGGSCGGGGWPCPRSASLLRRLMGFASRGGLLLTPSCPHGATPLPPPDYR